MCDSKGVIRTGRNDLNPQKAAFAVDTPHTTLAEAIDGADLFLGVSKAGALSETMVTTMADNPIIFAMANPTPEIMPDIVARVRPDAIMATGRSDFPNQINNVLGFPFIFRGALDVRSTAINEAMKIAAAKALAALAREPVPTDIQEVYGRELAFSRTYILPTPFDPRLITTVAPAVAQAAVDTGVSRLKSLDAENYIACLAKRLETRLHCVTRELPAS
jgi:malate dehydrogenase (oxaloacetate-decarboxylating)(NADP+)